VKWSSRPDPRPGRPRTANRPEIRDDRPKGVLFSTEGSTGWHRVRDIKGYKGIKKEADFHEHHHKFWSEGDDPVE
jgi:hypothetical protein